MAANQPQGEEVPAEGPDIALAKALQEQEQAWLYLLQPNPSNASASIGDESRETGSSVQTDQCVSSALLHVSSPSLAPPATVSACDATLPEVR